MECVKKNYKIQHDNLFFIFEKISRDSSQHPYQQVRLSTDLHVIM